VDIILLSLGYAREKNIAAPFFVILYWDGLHYTIHLLPVKQKLQSGSSEYISASQLKVLLFDG